MQKLKHETVREEKDGSTTTTSKSFAVKAKNSEDFFFTFISFMKPSLKIKSMRDVYVLTKLCMSMEFDSSKVFMPSDRRKSICDELKMKPTHFSNSLASLKDLGILSGGGGVFELNPIFFWKGRTDVRDKMLKEEGLEVKIRFGVKENDEVPMLDAPMYGVMPTSSEFE